MNLKTYSNMEHIFVMDYYGKNDTKTRYMIRSISQFSTIGTIHYNVPTCNTINCILTYKFKRIHTIRH